MSSRGGDAIEPVDVEAGLLVEHIGELLPERPDRVPHVEVVPLPVLVVVVPAPPRGRRRLGRRGRRGEERRRRRQRDRHPTLPHGVGDPGHPPPRRRPRLPLLDAAPRHRHRHTPSPPRRRPRRREVRQVQQLSHACLGDALRLGLGFGGRG